MPLSKDPEDRVVQVGVRSRLLRQILGGAEFSTDVFEARLELLLVSQKELVRMRRQSGDAAEERASTTALVRERDEALRRIFALNEALAMARFWHTRQLRELKGYQTTLGRLRFEVQMLRVHDQLRDVLIILAFAILGFLAGYAMRPVIDREPETAAQTESLSERLPHPRTPAEPSVHEVHRWNRNSR